MAGEFRTLINDLERTRRRRGGNTAAAFAMYRTEERAFDSGFPFFPTFFSLHLQGPPHTPFCVNEPTHVRTKYILAQLRGADKRGVGIIFSHR